MCRVCFNAWTEVLGRGCFPLALMPTRGSPELPSRVDQTAEQEGA